MFQKIKKILKEPVTRMFAIPAGLSIVGITIISATYSPAAIFLAPFSWSLVPMRLVVGVLMSVAAVTGALTLISVTNRK